MRVVEPPWQTTHGLEKPRAACEEPQAHQPYDDDEGHEKHFEGMANPRSAGRGSNNR